LIILIISGVEYNSLLQEFPGLLNKKFHRHYLLPSKRKINTDLSPEVSESNHHRKSRFLIIFFNVIFLLFFLFSKWYCLKRFPKYNPDDDVIWDVTPCRLVNGYL
jgi:hypothetical protein